MSSLRTETVFYLNLYHVSGTMTYTKCLEIWIHRMDPFSFLLASLASLQQGDFRIFGILISRLASQTEEVGAENFKELAQWHFHCIQLIKASHKVSLHSRTEKTDSTSSHEKEKAHEVGQRDWWPPFFETILTVFIPGYSNSSTWFKFYYSDWIQFREHLFNEFYTQL